MALWTIACQAFLSMEFFRQVYWSGLSFHTPGDLPSPGTEPKSPGLKADSLPAEILGKPIGSLLHAKNKMKGKFY